MLTESFRAPIFRSGPDKDGFSLGRHGNFQEIFGDDCKNWFLPVFSRYVRHVLFRGRHLFVCISCFVLQSNKINTQVFI